MAHLIKNSKMLINIFRGLTDSEPKDTTLEEVVHLITDDASVRDLTDKYRYYLSMSDERQARRFKELLPCFAVAVRFSGGKHKRNISAYTGLTIVDIDHVPAEKMQQVLALVREDPHTLLAYTTVSGLGVRVIARYEAAPNPSQGGEPRAAMSAENSQLTTNGQKLIDNSQDPSTAQDNSHADFTDYTENASLAGNINLTQTSQNSRNNISEQDNQRASQRAKCKFTCDFSASAASEDVNQQNLDTITQNTHCCARVCHPDGDDAAEQRLIATASQVNVAEQRLNAAEQQVNCDDSQVNAPCAVKGQQLTANSQEPNTKLTLGVVSRLEPIKGMDLVVPALAEVLKVHPDTQLLVVGDGTLRASMEEQAAQLGCADHIRFVGRQPQEELPQWYGQMDIVLMPSRSEGFGLTAIEAMACGCVMVASDTGGLPEVVRDGICGLLHRTEDVTDMAAKISTLIGDATLYDTLRTQSLVEVEKYSFERYAALMNDLYNKLGR